MLSIIHPPSILTKKIQANNSYQKLGTVICGARGPRPRFPRVWKTRKRIGTISKSEKLVQSVKELSNVKEEVYGALDSFIAWDLEFPLIVIKKALKTLEFQKEWKRMIQVIKWMLSKGQGQTMGTYYTLLNALTEDGRLEEAEELWSKIFSRYLDAVPRIFFIKMISIYYNKGLDEKMFEVFADMEELGVRPDQAIVRMLGDVFQKLSMHDKYKQLHMKYPPPKWEYRYIKGKRVKIRAKQLTDTGYNEAGSEAQVKQLTSADDIEDSVLLTSPDDEEAAAESDIEVEHFTAPDNEHVETEIRVQTLISLDDSEAERAGKQVPDRYGR